MALPLDKPLETELFRSLDQKQCVICNRPYIAKSNWAEYCPDCAVQIHQQQKGQSERKRRLRMDN